MYFIVIIEGLYGSRTKNNILWPELICTILWRNLFLTGRMKRNYFFSMISWTITTDHYPDIARQCWIVWSIHLLTAMPSGWVKSNFWGVLTFVICRQNAEHERSWIRILDKLENRIIHTPFSRQRIMSPVFFLPMTWMSGHRMPGITFSSNVVKRRGGSIPPIFQFQVSSGIGELILLE